MFGSTGRSRKRKMKVDRKAKGKWMVPPVCALDSKDIGCIITTLSWQWWSWGRTRTGFAARDVDDGFQ